MTFGEKMKIYLIVVVYNTLITDSLTCTNIINLTASNNLQCITIVVDNSEKDMGNQKIAHDFGFWYVDMSGNKGLSRAYNCAIESFISEADENDIIILLDDDTDITYSFFCELTEALKKYPGSDIYCPVMRGTDGKIYSPNEYHFLKNKQLKDPCGHISQERFNAINSCTAVKAHIYKSYRYDERLFLDQVDHKFFEDQRALGRTFTKLDCVIEQHFSSIEKGKTSSSVKKRYRLMIRDFMTYSSRKTSLLILSSVKVFGWSLRESYHCRDMLLLPWFLHEYISWFRHGERLAK